MYGLIALVVLCTAIFVFFLDEFTELFKKIIALPGVKLLVPLILASWLIEYYELFWLWVLFVCKDIAHAVIHTTSVILPFQTGSVTAGHIIQLFLIACLPIWGFIGYSKYKKTPKPWPYTNHFASLVWIIAVILLTVHQP